jgi:hypothetical protein
LTNVGKRPDNFEFSEKNVRGHDGRDRIFKVMKAQGMIWDHLFRNDG